MLGMAFRERFRGSTALFYLVLLSLMTPGLLLSLGTTLLTSYLGRDVSIYTTALGVQSSIATTRGRKRLPAISALARYARCGR